MRIFQLYSLCSNAQNVELPAPGMRAKVVLVYIFATNKGRLEKSKTGIEQTLYEATLNLIGYCGSSLLQFLEDLVPPLQ